MLQEAAFDHEGLHRSNELASFFRFRVIQRDPDILYIDYGTTEYYKRDKKYIIYDSTIDVAVVITSWL